MKNLACQRCFNHVLREAVARCPECGKFFCRECVTEHDDRVVCAACLKELTRIPFLRRSAFAGAARVFQCLLGFIVAWFFFYLIGEGLIALPASFHEGAAWHVKALDKE